MTDQHTKGAVSRAKGQINEGVGKLTGNKGRNSKARPSRSRAERSKASATSRTRCARPEAIAADLGEVG